MKRPTEAVAIDDLTRAAQAAASDPRASAWVSANAGAGKTYVLVERVVRLLLAGADPGRILCLTFTKAAAAEMAKRVFERLAEWTGLDDKALAAALSKLEGRRARPEELIAARRLFARALETPGGLKIQTIHAFCERLLHQFPFEANVPGHFDVLDERDSRHLTDDARRGVLARAAREPDSDLGRAFATAVSLATDFALEAGIAEFVAKRDRLRQWIVRAGSLEDAIRELRAELGVADGDTAEALRAAILGECTFTAPDLARLVELLGEGGIADRGAAERLAPCLAGDPDSRTAAYLAFCLTDQGKLRSVTSLVSKAVHGRWPGLAERLADEFARLAALLDRLKTTECCESSVGMLRLADAAITEYERKKRERGVLDFEDLVVKTADLLTRADAARWVHYKLDRGLEHILVDEAQDTSPRQWQVISTLVEETFAGEGASEGRPRTFFAVGDEKQSIFSFQGAVPAWFSRTRAELGGRAEAGGYVWHEPALHLSFRSVPRVLEAVDEVFARPNAHAGLSADNAAPSHGAARHRSPGRVIFWPMIVPPARTEADDWTMPVDHLGEKSPQVLLAERIARTISGWLGRREKIEATGEPITAGKILILSRVRGAQTDAINRALKSRKIPIAGADRITITEHIAVMDLMALGRVMLLPEDDLSLAALLKSPLIGLSEDDLFAIAHGRPHTLWDALGRAAVTTGGAFAEARARLDGWRRLADYLDPYAFFARILGPERGRRSFLTRLGSEAEEVLDEFLAQALAFERAHVPSLEGFLAFLSAADTEVRRDPDTKRDEVRVMTVHGAKGLEAEIVFLVDNGGVPAHPTHDPRLLSLADDRDGSTPPIVWMRRAGAMPDRVHRRLQDVREQAREEYRRLLYVAMTRARDRLYICGTLKQNTDKVGGWHGLISAALEGESTPLTTPEGEAFEWRATPRIEPPPKGDQVAFALRPQKPAWLDLDAPPPPPVPRRLVPSAVTPEEDEAGLPPVVRAGASLARRGDREGQTALARGRHIHRLLQSLPEIAAEARRTAGERYLAAVAAGWPEVDRGQLLDEVMAVLADPAFAPVFAPGSRAEVDVAALLPIGGQSTLSGRIDRLAVTSERVLIVDYKTNRPAPEALAEVPQAYIAQLALYREVLRRLYPALPIAAAILWTDRPALMEIPAGSLDAALAGLASAAGNDGEAKSYAVPLP